MRVLFLDIDGVLNSVRTCIANGGYPHRLTPDDLARLDQVSIALLRGLCVAGDVSVVVSSSWRILMGWDEIGRALKLPTIDATPRLAGCRGSEIADWLSQHPEVTQYAIIDDDRDMLPEQMPYFVKTNGFDGLIYPDFERLCDIFGVLPHDCRPRKIEFRDGALHRDWDGQ